MQPTLRNLLACALLSGTATTAAAAPAVATDTASYPKLAGGGMSLQYLGGQVQGEGQRGLLQGGRAFHYVAGGRLRFGGMGLRGALSDDSGDERTLSYGGFTGEYVFRPGHGVEVPVGLLLGAGGVGLAAGDSERLVVLVPMVAIEVNPVPWMKLGLGTGGTLGLGTKHGESLRGLSAGLYLAFGRFDARTQE